MDFEEEIQNIGYEEEIQNFGNEEDDEDVVFFVTF